MSRKLQGSPRGPTKSLLARLDNEHFQRATDGWHNVSNGNSPDYSEIVSSEAVRNALAGPKLVIPSFRIPDIYSNYMFSNRLFVFMCPTCIEIAGLPSVLDVLKCADLIPVLLADYVDFPLELIGTILQMPHMSRYELQSYRTMRVLSVADQSICGHCVQQRHDQISKKVSAFDRGGNLFQAIQRTFRDLDPFVSPDYELIDALNDAVDSKDTDAIFTLSGASESIYGLRTSQAFESRWTLDATQIPSLIKSVKGFVKSGSSDPVLMPTSSTNPLSLIVIPKMDPIQYFELAHQYRDELSNLVDHIVAESSGNTGLFASQMASILGELNAEVAKLQKNKRYLAYRAGFGFLRANRTLIGTALAAGTLGLAGSIVGCGATVAFGVAGKLLKKAGRLQASPETTAFLEGVKKSIRPKLHRLLSSYTGISLPAVQLHEIRRGIKEKTSSSTASSRDKRSKS